MVAHADLPDFQHGAAAAEELFQRRDHDPLAIALTHASDDGRAKKVLDDAIHDPADAFDFCTCLGPRSYVQFRNRNEAYKSADLQGKRAFMRGFLTRFDFLLGESAKY